jgi:hypothetical protein
MSDQAWRQNQGRVYLKASQMLSAMFVYSMFRYDSEI